MILNTNEELALLCIEEHIRDENGVEHHVEVLQNKYNSSGRHQEYWDFVFNNPIDNKIYGVQYSVSVKDMGWDECNYPPHTLYEMEEKTIIEKIYVHKK